MQDCSGKIVNVVVHHMYDFIGAFAKCATTFSNAKYEWVARRGKYSIYALLSNLAPKVC